MTTSLPASVAHSALTPPDAVPAELPVHTRHQVLPFEALTWENFERLCHRLTALDGDVEYCSRFGKQGEAQEGIDIYARLQDGTYHCLQAKRHRKFSISQLAAAVDLFLTGTWAERAARFTIALQTPFRSTREQEAVEKQAARLGKKGIVFAVLDGESMTEQLRCHPTLIDDFFGRAWVVALLGHSAAERLGGRLDGAEFARLRLQLAKVYEADFHFVDPGSFGSVTEDSGRPELSLLERFLIPDIVVRETVQHRDSPQGSDTVTKPSATGGDALSAVASAPLQGMGAIESLATGRTRRLPFMEWCGEAQRMVLLGEAGCGKSTCLRVIALDLLHHQQHFPALAKRWGNHIPLYIPFALWSSQIERDSSTIGIKEIVRRSLQQVVSGTALLDLVDRAISEQRILLLVDGLDEWGSVQAARTTLRALVTVAEAHNLPAIVSGRPRGLESIGTLPANWKRGTVAPLSVTQQGIIARRWFDRYGTVEITHGSVSANVLRTERFMAELARDANLQALAAVPLLLIGLVTLTLRGQILPRTRNDMYDQLIRILLEVHPDRRATASGDTIPRFRHARDPAQRRAAIGKLAFIIRQQTGGAGIAQVSACDILADYLASPEGCDLPLGEAVAAAGEMLSVNAETQGLLVEKAPGEVGFVHASFEEFLGAEYISGWSFSDIQAFIDQHAGESRWRNVISNLMGHIKRRGEFDQLIATIENSHCGALERYQRQFLLGDIAFGAALRWTSTAKRLVLATLARVETEQWLPAQQEALSSVLKGLGDETLKADLEQRFASWLPARSGYERASLARTLGSWPASRRLQELLLQAMNDEDRNVQRAAAEAYSSAFAPSAEAGHRLLVQIAATLDSPTAVALLMSLALGWPSLPAAQQLFEDAQHSLDAEMRLVGILGHAENGILTDEARDTVLKCQSFWSDIAYPYRDLATAMLLKYWSGDETLIQRALKRVSHEAKAIWEYDGAIAFLLNSPVTHAGVRDWIIIEFKHKEFPFNSIGRSMWSQLGRFAAVDPAIRSAANAFWLNPKSRMTKLHELPNYVASISDPELAELLTEILLTTKEANFDRYWAFKALLTGWGHEHNLVKSALDALAGASDDELLDLVPFLADIMRNKGAARARLIKMSTLPAIRRDMLAAGFENCGCNGDDDEVVAAILSHPIAQSNPFNPYHVLLRSFGKHTRVRRLAADLIHDADAPLAAIAAAYPQDPEYAEWVRAALLPLRVELRTQIVELSKTGSSGTILENVLAKARLESDSELQARMTINYYSALASADYPRAKQRLLAQVVEVGPNYEIARACALVGLVMIGELDALATAESRGKPIELEVGTHYEPIPSVARLICERLSEFEAAFGNNLQDRFRSLSNRDGFSQIICAAPGASQAARSRFLAMAEQGNFPMLPAVLRMLALERPNSTLLRERCMDVLNKNRRDNRAVVQNADIGLILRDHFPNDAGIRQYLVERYRNQPVTEHAVALAMVAPEAPELSFTSDFSVLGNEIGDWAVAILVGARRAPSDTFCQLLAAMVCRNWRTQFDAQHIINLAVGERLASDVDLEPLLCAQISEDAHPSIIGSFTRYLAAAGRLSSANREKALALLATLEIKQRLPLIGYDAIADQKRTLRLILLDALASGLEYA